MPKQKIFMEALYWKENYANEKQLFSANIALNKQLFHSDIAHSHQLLFHKAFSSKSDGTVI